MTNPAEALVQRYLDAFNAGNPAGMLDCVSENVAHDVNQGARRDGKSLFAEFLRHMERCYREELRDIVIMSSPCGLRVAAEYVVYGRYQATDDGLPPAKGQTYVLPAGSFFSISNGKIDRVTTYYNLAHWIKQVSG